MKYEVPFTGFVYVEAESLDEALEMAQNGCITYEEKEFDTPEGVSEFYLRL